MTQTNQPLNASETKAVSILRQCFGEAFGKTEILTNLIFETPTTAAVRSCEVDCIVVCKHGLFIFEVKGWQDCTVRRVKIEGEEPRWSFTGPDGKEHVVRDPVNQVGGKHKAISDIVRQSLVDHIEAHQHEVATAVEPFLIADTSSKKSVRSPLVSPDLLKQCPNLRTRSFVLCPMPGVEIDVHVPQTVLRASDVSFMVRLLMHEVKKHPNSCMQLTDSLIDRITTDLRAAGSILTMDQHLSNLKEAHPTAAI